MGIDAVAMQMAVVRVQESGRREDLESLSKDYLYPLARLVLAEKREKLRAPCFVEFDDFVQNAVVRCLRVVPRVKGNAFSALHRTCYYSFLHTIRSEMEAQGAIMARFCAVPGCPRMAAGDSCYCGKHRAERRRGSRVYDRERGTAAKRGYDREWREFAKAFLLDHPFCNRCGAVSVMVHHRKPLKEGGERLDKANCEALCQSCHLSEHRGDGTL